MKQVVISGNRAESSSFDMPAAIDAINSQRISEAQMRVNLSEALAAVPGLVLLNRQNYAQDLQISSRGFGARSAFGVRGVRLLSDGIPATMPDGQGQAASFNLDIAERIEVLRGPLTAMYGNHSGGVLQLITKNGHGSPSVEATAIKGSDGVTKLDIQAQGQAGGFGYILDSSGFQTDGYREHSAAKRNTNFAKLTFAPWEKSKLTFIFSDLHQADSQDPLGVQWQTFRNDPRAAEIDPTDTQPVKRSFAERYNTHKSIAQQQFSIAFEQRLEDDHLRLNMYGGTRQVSQYQAFSKTLQLPVSHSGGVVDFDRQFYGLGLDWQHITPLAGGRLSTHLGLDYASSTDQRQGYENFIGTQYGVKGNLRRDEQDLVSNLDPYLQAEWSLDSWLISAGLRHGNLDIRVRDHFLSNGDDSGSRNYSNNAQFAGVLYALRPNVNLYASAARGYESPTLNELFYSGNGNGFNFKLLATQNTQVEAGAKFLLNKTARLNIAIFETRTKDELVVDVSAGGRSSYRNASQTLRQGLELALDANWDSGLSTRIAATGLRAIYQQAFANATSGNRLPGVPAATLYADLGWHDKTDTYSTGMELIASSKLYVEDSNKELPAPGYAIANIRLASKQNWHGWQISEFFRLNNLFDKSYVGSVIVGDANKRYYEAALGRNRMLGVSARYSFQ
ncbi:TonB-dependent receptor family protein [Undibacterium sp. TJN19]|uniref:TonB-dependent receptor family protein n=1 Tax=Undibacterium sp. TJN19 TaxID=3413055 RepID=UPI003BF19C06